ncbi:kelch domain-containing protein 10 homolog [Epargyreus clarus]|uniref:kelch domain-containing protein 10 homolog n=1 Tax=Epargyreus clarus TaxID=520877 RepID=UPI003C2C02C7
MSSSNKDYIFEPFKVIEVKFEGPECPRPRSGHRIACDDVNIYCFGGYNPSLPPNNIQRENPTWTAAKPLFKELWSFSIATKKWTQHRVVENMPEEELASNAACMYGRYLMIYGGTGAPFGNKCSNDIITWRTCRGDAKLRILDVIGQRPPGQYGQTILCHDGYFYTIGGTNGYAYNCDIFRLDLRKLTWEPVFVGTGQEGEPMGRYRHEVARVGDKLYIIGGGTGDWAFELMEIPTFDLQTNTWTILIPKADQKNNKAIVPLARKCHSAVQIDTPDGAQVFVAGGSDGVYVFDDFWRLNISDLQWTRMQKTALPHPLYFHSSTVTSYGCMYVFGGIEPKDDTICRKNNLYKVWLCIPKLSEICWEALLSFSPKIDQIDRQTLLNMGIPLHFVDRIHMM